jgi:hypothetical protein
LVLLNTKSPNVSLGLIIISPLISSYENNAAFRNQLVNTFNSHYTQNIKYSLTASKLHILVAL